MGDVSIPPEQHYWRLTIEREGRSYPHYLTCDREGLPENIRIHNPAKIEKIDVDVRVIDMTEFKDLLLKG